MTIRKSITEGNLLFEFDEGVNVVKFDETEYYKYFKDCMDGNKGVDFLAYNDKHFVLIEIKDFTGSENDKTNIKRLMTSIPDFETLDIEMSEKVRSTIAAVLGGHVKQDIVIDEYFGALRGKILKSGEFVPTIDVILFIEGDIEKMVGKKGVHQETRIAFRSIQDKLKRKLKWLTDRVSVENIQLRRAQRFFEVKRV